MSQQQGSIADNLVSILQSIQMKSMTGELRVKRGEGISTEIGSMSFVQGRIVSAQIGSYTGPTAFNLLKTWGRCVFIFIPQPIPSALQQNSPVASPISQALPVIMPQQGSPTFSGDAQEAVQNSPAFSHSSPQGPTTDPIGRTGSPSSSGSHSRISPFAIPRATMSVFKAVGVIEKAGLPRTYRQVMLMVDGRASVNDLIGPSGFSLEEIQHILYTLEQLLLIRTS